jgi:hypothetical protein
MCSFDHKWALFLPNPDELTQMAMFIGISFLTKSAYAEGARIGTGI